jgi:hypothetical protein
MFVSSQELAVVKNTKRKRIQMLAILSFVSLHVAYECVAESGRFYTSYEHQQKMVAINTVECILVSMVYQYLRCIIPQNS